MSKTCIENLLPKIILESQFPKKFDREEIRDSSSFGKIFVEQHTGSTDDSNYLIPKRVLMTRYPFKKYFNPKNEEHYEQAVEKVKKLLIDSQIDVFVNLQKKNEKIMMSPDYKEFILKTRDELEKEYKEIPSKIDFYDWEIEDMKTSTLEATKKWIKILIELYKKGKNILIHCMGGHGRTGLIAGCFIGALYPDLKYSEILKFVQAAHSCRIQRRKSFAPQKAEQFLQIAEFIGEKRIDDRGKFLIKKFKGVWKDYDFYVGIQEKQTEKNNFINI